MRRIQHSRRGFTIMELIIALGLFSALTVALLQSQLGIIGFVSQEEGLGDVATMGRQAISQITNDIANTAWFYQYTQSSHNFANPLTPLYPIVTKGTVVTAANGTTTELDSIEFIKIRTSTNVASSPYGEHYSSLPFSTAAAPPALVTLNNYNASATSIPYPTYQTTSTPLLVVNPNYPQAPGAFDILVSHVWESGTAGYTFDENMNPLMLRHTRLEVITSSGGVQQLVRSYYNGNGSQLPTDVNGSWNPQDQVVLMDYVTSFVINTQQNTLGTTNDIQPNQITFTITVVKPNPNNPTISTTRTFTVYASMRSISH